MYVVLGLILTIMGLTSTLEGSLSTTRKAGRNRFEIFPEEEESVTDQFPTNLSTLLVTNIIELRRQKDNNLEENHVVLNEVLKSLEKPQIHFTGMKKSFNYTPITLSFRGKKKGKTQNKLSNLRNHHKTVTDNLDDLRFHRDTNVPVNKRKKTIKAVIFISEPNLKIKLNSMKGFANELTVITTKENISDAGNKKFTEPLSGVTDGILNHDCYTHEGRDACPILKRINNQTNLLTLPTIKIQQDMGKNVFCFDLVLNGVNDLTMYPQGTNVYCARTKHVNIREQTLPTTNTRCIHPVPDAANYKLRFDEKLKYPDGRGCQCQDEGDEDINITDPVITISLEPSLKKFVHCNKYPQDADKYSERGENINNQPDTTTLDRTSSPTFQDDTDNTLNILPLNEVSRMIKFQELEGSDCTCDEYVNGRKESQTLRRISIKPFQDFTNHTLGFSPSIKESDQWTKYPKVTDEDCKSDEDTNNEDEFTTLPSSSIQYVQDDAEMFRLITSANEFNDRTKFPQVEGGDCTCNEDINDESVQQTLRTTGIQYIQDVSDQTQGSSNPMQTFNPLLKEFDLLTKYPQSTDEDCRCYKDINYQPELKTLHRSIAQPCQHDANYVVVFDPSLEHINQITRDPQDRDINNQTKPITLKKNSIQPVQNDVDNTLWFYPSLTENEEEDSVDVEGKFKDYPYTSDWEKNSFSELKASDSFDHLVTAIGNIFENEIDADIIKRERDSTIIDDDDLDNAFLFDVTGVNDAQLSIDHEVEPLSTLQPLNKLKKNKCIENENCLSNESTSVVNLNFNRSDNFKDVEQGTTKHLRKKSRRVGKKQRKHNFKLKKKVTKIYSKTICNRIEKKISLPCSTTDSSLFYSCVGNSCFFDPIWNAENKKQHPKLKMSKAKLIGEKDKTIEDEILKQIQYPTSTSASVPKESVNIKIKKEPPLREESEEESYNCKSSSFSHIKNYSIENNLLFSNFSFLWDALGTDLRSKKLATSNDYIAKLQTNPSLDWYLSKLFRKLIDEDEKPIHKDQIPIAPNVKDKESQRTTPANDGNMTIVIDIVDDEKVPTTFSKGYVTDSLSAALAEMLAVVKLKMPMAFTNETTPSYDGQSEKYSAVTHLKNQPITALFNNKVNEITHPNFPVTTPINFKTKEVESSQNPKTIKKVDLLLKNIFELYKHLSTPQEIQVLSTQVNFSRSSPVTEEDCDEINCGSFSTASDCKSKSTVHIFDRHTVEETTRIYCENSNNTMQRIISESCTPAISKSELITTSRSLETTCYSVSDIYGPTIQAISHDDKTNKHNDIFTETFGTSCYPTSDISNSIKTNTKVTELGDHVTGSACHSYSEDKTVKMICYPVSEFNENLKAATSRTEEKLHSTMYTTHCKESLVPTVSVTRHDDLNHKTENNSIAPTTTCSTAAIHTTEPVKTSVLVSKNGDNKTVCTFYSSHDEPQTPISYTVSLFEESHNATEIKNESSTRDYSTQQYQPSNEQHHWDNKKPRNTICYPVSEIQESPDNKPTEIENETSKNYHSTQNTYDHEVVTLTYQINTNEHQTLEEKKHSAKLEITVATSLDHASTFAKHGENGHEIIDTKNTIPSNGMINETTKGQASPDVGRTVVPFKYVPEDEGQHPCYCTGPSNNKHSVSATLTSSTKAINKKYKMRYYPPFAYHQILPSQWASLELKPKNNNVPHFDVLPMDYAFNSPTEPMYKINRYRFGNNRGRENEPSLGVFVTKDEQLPPGFYKLDDLEKLHKFLSTKSTNLPVVKQTTDKIIPLNKIKDETRLLYKILYPGLVHYPVLSRRNALPNYLIKTSCCINGLSLMDKNVRERNPVARLPRRPFLHSFIKYTKKPRSEGISSKLKTFNNNAISKLLKRYHSKKGSNKISNKYEILHNQNTKFTSERMKNSNLDDSIFYWNTNSVPKESVDFLDSKLMKKNLKYENSKLSRLPLKLVNA